LKSIQLILLVIFTFQSNAQILDFETIDFKKADRIALSYNDEDLSNLSDLSYKLTENLDTDVERFRAIYRWVCNNIANDYSLYLKNKNKRERFKKDSIKFTNWNNDFRKTLFKKLRKRKKTICTGYAYLVKELAEFADLECKIIQGYGRVSTTDIENLTLPNHSWNAVKLNNKWYLCDPTWASGIPNPETNRFAFKYNDGFFLAEPEVFAVNHFPVEAKWWLLDVDMPTFKDFLAAPVIYGNAYETLSLHTQPKKMHHQIKTDEHLDFEYKLKALVEPEAIHFIIDSGDHSWKTQPTSVRLESDVLKLKHQFKSTGFYDVHLYIENALIATYTVDVEK